MGPMRLRPAYVEMVWGGGALKRYFGRMIPSEHTGESWEASAHPKGISVIENGVFAGKTLEQAVAEAPIDILGQAVCALSNASFPLLVKLISAADALSIQVHPSDETGAPLGGQGKTEAWMILDAEEGAELVYALEPGVTKARLAAAMREGTAVEALLGRKSVRAGDVFFIPAGLVHAIGKGILLYEVQQNSDTTYRLYDWGRTGLDGKPRELHQDEALRVIDFTSAGACPSGFARKLDGGWRKTYIICPYFALEKLLVWERMTVDTGGRFHVLTALSGEGSVMCGGETVPVRAGDTVIVPGSQKTYGLCGKMDWIVSHVPDVDAMKRELANAGWVAGRDDVALG